LRDYHRKKIAASREEFAMMEIADEITIPATRAAVYEALNDIEILKACIPGCESLERESDTKLVARVVLKIGPVKAKFNGFVTLDQSKAPDGFSLSGEGEGGLAGFAKGGADVTLTEDGDTTILHYTATAETGGKIAQLGSRLITSTAKKLSKMFFEKFEKAMIGEVEIDSAS
jgi:carbon monoxide dehydrogenase subunit G